MLVAQMERVPLYPEGASTLADEVDPLFFFILAVTLFFTLLIAVLIVGFLVKYRRRSAADRPAHIHGSMSLELVWTIIPLLIAIGIFVWGSRVFVSWATPPDDAMESFPGLALAWSINSRTVVTGSDGVMIIMLGTRITTPTGVTSSRTLLSFLYSNELMVTVGPANSSV